MQAVLSAAYGLVCHFYGSSIFCIFLQRDIWALFQIFKEVF